MRVVAWNMKRGREATWRFLEELGPDIALLSEVGGIPKPVAAAFNVIEGTAVRKTGGPQAFRTALLARNEVLAATRLTSSRQWVDRELDRLARGHFPAASIHGSPRNLDVVSVYVPAWPVLEAAQLADLEDVDQVKGAKNPHVWGTDLLIDALAESDLSGSWLVGGDFNSCETLSSAGREFLARMSGLGLTDVLRASTGRLTPTFRHPRTKKVRNQIDHLFVTPALLGRLVKCEVGDADRVFGGRLSDHLPIIADFADEIQDPDPDDKDGPVAF